METQRRNTPADVSAFYENSLLMLKSNAITNYLRKFGTFGAQLEDRFTTQSEKKLSIIFKALKDKKGNAAPSSEPRTLWLQELEDNAMRLEDLLGDIENFQKRQTTITEDQNELSSDRPNLETSNKGGIEPSSDETDHQGLESTGEESEVDSDEEELPQDELVTNNQGASICKRIHEYVNNFEDNIYAQGVRLGVIKDIVETSHEEQTPLIVSQDNVIQNGSEEPSVSIDLESLQSPNRELNLSSRTTSLPIQRQRRNENDSLFHWLPKKIMSMFGMPWLYRVLNVIFEILLFVLIEENDKGNIGDSLCHMLVFITSAICFLLSICEFCLEANRSHVVWQRRGNCCWFYNPGNDGLLFGYFSLYFSIILSAVQFFINLIVLFLKEFIKADVLGLLFAVASFIASMCHPREPQRND